MAEQGFHLHLDAFDGPFDLLLQLIHRRKLEITDIALHQVTDEFLRYTAALSEEKNLDDVTEFLVVAATLLDLKAARLLPRGDMIEPEDMELLEARDLLFARLLQYRAYQQLAATLGEWYENTPRQYHRCAPLEEQFQQCLPPLSLEITLEELRDLAIEASAPPPVPAVATEHMHIPYVSVTQQTRHIMRVLQQEGVGREVLFSQLVEDSKETMTTVGRFMSLLELYRVQAVDLRQEQSFSPLYVTLNDNSTEESVLEAIGGEREDE